MLLLCGDNAKSAAKSEPVVGIYQTLQVQMQPGHAQRLSHREEDYAKRLANCLAMRSKDHSQAAPVGPIGLWISFDSQ